VGLCGLSKTPTPGQKWGTRLIGHPLFSLEYFGRDFGNLVSKPLKRVPVRAAVQRHFIDLAELAEENGSQLSRNLCIFPLTSTGGVAQIETASRNLPQVVPAP
jgi:hypothetical protein